MFINIILLSIAQTFSRCLKIMSGDYPNLSCPVHSLHASTCIDLAGVTAMSMMIAKQLNRLTTLATGS